MTMSSTAAIGSARRLGLTKVIVATSIGNALEWYGVSCGEIQRAFGGRPAPRKKRTRPERRQYTLVDLERARDRVEAAQRRVDNDRTNKPNRGRG